MVKSSAVVFETPGEPSTALRVVSAELPPIKDDEILFKTLAAPINPSDLSVVKGVYPIKNEKTTLYTKEPVTVGGFESALEAVEVGKNVTDIKVGDWALCRSVTLGTWRSHHIFKSDEVIPFPRNSGIDPITASTVLVNPLSAYQLLTRYVTLKSGDWVIQNGANSVVGRSVIKFAKLWGIKTVNVVRERKDFEELEADLKSLGATVVITDKQLPDFVKNIPKYTGEETNPIKLGLDCVGDVNGSSIALSVQPRGHFVIYGIQGKAPSAISPASLIFHDIHVRGYWLGGLISYEREKIDKNLGEIFKIIAAGQFGPPAPTETNILKGTDEEKLKTVLRAMENSQRGYGPKQILTFE